MLNAGSVDVSKAEDETMALLPEDFVPGKWDVICQRGKECYDHGKCDANQKFCWIHVSANLLT